MGGVLHPELQGDNTVKDVETPGKTKSKCPGYFHVLDPREMLPDTNCLEKTALGATMGKPYHALEERLQMHTAFHASAILLVCFETKPGKKEEIALKIILNSLLHLFFHFLLEHTFKQSVISFITFPFDK